MPINTNKPTAPATGNAKPSRAKPLADTVAAAATTVEAAREAFATGAATGYGAGRVYARFLNENLGADWYDVPLPRASKDKPDSNRVAAIRAEQTALYGRLTAFGHTNPSVPWGMLKKYAAQEAAAKAKAEATANGEGGDAGEGDAIGGKREVRDMATRNLDELTKLHAANVKAIASDDTSADAKAKLAKVNAGIETALTALGWVKPKKSAK